jgi:hypothetical protein
LCSGGKVRVPDCNGSGATAAYADPSSSKFLRTDRSILILSEKKRDLYHARPVKSIRLFHIVVRFVKLKQFAKMYNIMGQR